MRSVAEAGQTRDDIVPAILPKQKNVPSRRLGGSLVGSGLIAVLMRPARNGRDREIHWTGGQTLAQPGFGEVGPQQDGSKNRGKTGTFAETVYKSGHSHSP